MRRRDVPAALALLDSMGYQPWSGWQAALRHVGLEYALDAAIAMGLGSARGTVIDLHWKASSTGITTSADELIARADVLHVEGRSALVPPPGLALSMLIGHGHKSAWPRLRFLVDVAEGLEKLSATEHESVSRHLHDMGMTPALAEALQLVHGLWGRLPTHAGPLRPVTGALEARRLRHYATTLEGDRDWSSRRDPWRPVRMLHHRARISPSLPGVLLKASRPGYQDWAFARLPRPLRFGYRVVRVIRVLLEALRGEGARPRAAAEADGPGPEKDPTSAVGSVPLTLVTAIYDHGPSSAFGGRGRNVHDYLPSLANIANLGAPIVVFCPEKDARTVEDAISCRFREWRVIPYELDRFEHFETFMGWKESYRQSLPVNDRNEVLCFLKSYWVQHAVAENFFGHDTFFWIDAGLTHHGIFPERVGGVELRADIPASHYHPRNGANIFTPDLGAALARATAKGRVFFCALPFRDVRRSVYESVVATRRGRAPEHVRIEDHLVGGLFGGHRDDLAAVHRLYAELLKELIDARVYTLEEQVFSCLNVLHPELFALKRFGTWWFHSPGERTSYLEAEGESFYRIFTDLLAETKGNGTALSVRPEAR